MDFQPLHTTQPLFSHHAPNALTLGGVHYTVPVCVFPDTAPQSAPQYLEGDVFEWVLQLAPCLLEAQAEVILIGTGNRLRFPVISHRQKLCESGLTHLEWMDTAAACRTYNVLTGEGRRVAGLFWIGVS